MSDEWQNGYSAGYQNGWQAGYERGKTEGLPKNPYQQPQQDWLRQQNVGTTCYVCGMFFEVGKAYGYVCGNSRCPKKVTCTTSTVASSSIPDGLSYEEIYGSVIYQQNKKKET